MALNARQEAFINAYLQCFNATKAAIMAGYSEKTAYSIGSRLLKNVEVAAEIERRMSEAAMPATEVMYHLAQIARADIDDIMTVHGNVPFVDMDKAKEAAKTGLIKKIKVTKTGIEFELHDKMRALELIGKHHALFSDTLKVEDWRSQAIAAIQKQQMDYDALADELGHDLATELFRQAGVVVTSQD